jgi:hypothetical protein
MDGGGATKESKMLTCLRVGLEGGAEAGLVSGAVLAVTRVLVLADIAVLILWFAPRHSQAAHFAKSLVWVGLKFPAFPFVGDRALDPGFDAGIVALGLVTHFAGGIAWGILFGLVASGHSRWATILLAILWGLVAGLGEAACLSHLIGGGVLEDWGLIAFAFLIYGLTLGRTLLRFERRNGWPARRAYATAAR